MIIWNKVTWYSRYLALIFFTVLFPLWAFYLGTEYQKTVSEINYYSSEVIPLPQKIHQENTTSTTTSEILNSGIKGMVTISPVCPVERIPPDPNCAPQAFAATLNVVNQQNGEEKIVTSGEDGIYQINLRPGNYAIINANNTPLPRMEDYYVSVVNNEYTVVNIQFDSGIR